MKSIKLSCECGKIKGVALNISRFLNARAFCYCDDCQAYAHFLKKPEKILDQWGGTDITPIAPANLKIETGIENLGCLRLSPKGMFRWYAKCCNTPLGNTQAEASLPFVGVIDSFMDHRADGETREQALGPIKGRMMGKSAYGHNQPHDMSTRVSMKQMVQFISFMTTAFVGRKAKPNPFYSDDGKTKTKVQILTEPERATLAQQCKQGIAQNHVR